MCVGIIYLYEWLVGIMCVGIMYSMPPKIKLVIRGEMSFDISPSTIYCFRCSFILEKSANFNT